MDFTCPETGKEVDNNRDKISAKDYKFYGVNFIKTMSAACAKQADCPDCKKNGEKLFALAKNYPELIKTSVNTRKEYEQIIAKIENHLRRDHEYAPENYYKPMYSGLGIFAGAVASIIIWFLIIKSAALCWAIIGTLMIAGRIAGGVKDKKKIKEQKTY